MLMTLAGNGGGKGDRCHHSTNLLTYPGSVFVNDTKGQNAAVTARVEARDGAGLLSSVRRRDRASQSACGRLILTRPTMSNGSRALPRLS